MLWTADKASLSGRAYNSEQGHSLKMADEILDALQKIDARVASIETTLHKVVACTASLEARTASLETSTASIETVLNEVEHDISGVKMRLERIEHYSGLVTPLPS